jgi:ERCC4-related helicase
MQLFTGKTPAKKRKEVWEFAEFIFSTPQCISNDLKKRLYNLNEVSLLVIDECHRCVKNYAYNKIAENYKSYNSNGRVLGLTASPGSDKETITQVCENLGIKEVQKLTKDPFFAKAYSLATLLQIEHPKLKTLKNIITEQFQKDPNSKIIIFAQFRETVRTISELLNKIEGIRADNFVGQAIKDHGKGKTTGLKQKEQKEMIEKFREGKINVLVATSIAEEGLDIPEVNEVIFYEPIPSAIRKIQRAGRTARLSKGSLKILVTKNTLDEIYHYTAHNKEKRMHKAIDQIKKSFDPGEKQKKLF